MSSVVKGWKKVVECRKVGLAAGQVFVNVVLVECGTRGFFTVRRGTVSFLSTISQVIDFKGCKKMGSGAFDYFGNFYVYYNADVVRAVGM